MASTGRCAVCREEHPYDEVVTPRTRCVGCGARGAVRVVKVQMRAYVPTGEVRRPPLPQLARELEVALAAARAPKPVRKGRKAKPRKAAPVGDPGAVRVSPLT